jgi:hypothetical protein
MANKVQSTCLCRRDIFTVDVRNRGRQKYCPKRRSPRCSQGGAAALLAGPNRRTGITSADRNTCSGCGSGGPSIRGIGALTNVGTALRYKTPRRCKSLKKMRIWSCPPR